MHPSRPSILVLALPLIVGCAHATRLDPLEGAARDASAGGADARTLALAGFHAYLAAGDAASLEKHASLALAKDPGEPWALAARAESARRALRPADEASALLEILRRTPAHPLATLAAGRLARLARVSLALDEAIVRGAEGALARGVDGETAARLRSVVRGIQVARGEDFASVAAAAGLLTEAAVVGPFSAFRNLDVETAFPPESGAVKASYPGAGGQAVAPRAMRFPTGAIDLAPEPRLGDVFYLLAVADVPRGGTYVVRLAGTEGGSVALRIDGVPVLARSSLGVPGPTALGAAVELEAGSHLVALRVVRGAGRGDALVAVAPADGGPSGVRFRAARPGDAPGEPPSRASASGFPITPTAAAVARELDDAGVLGDYLAAGDAAERDVRGATALLAQSLALLPRSPALLTLRAEMDLADPWLPDSVGSARASAALEQALASDPGSARALTAQARLLAGSGRQDDALEKLEAAAAASPESTEVALERARVQLDRGLDAMARELAEAALRRDPGSCEAARLAADLSERADAVARADEIAARFVACPGGRSRLSTLREKRGDLARALEISRAERERSPADPNDTLRVADLLLAQGKPAEAAAEIAAVEALWPRTPHLPRRRAELLGRAGDVAGARAARDRVLQLDGGDLGLRRALAYEQGTEVMGDLHADAFEVIRDFEARGETFETPAVVLLDFAGIQAFPDGSTVERTQTIAQVRGKAGIDDLGEFELPAGAQLLALRTIKKDGRVLEPEAISGKDTISMPGLEVGDYVEREYLTARSGRGPAMPGWSSSPFFFREPGLPLLDSVFVVRASKEAGLEMDVHNGMERAPVEEKDGWLTATFRRTGNPAVIPEPSQPSRFETLPWVQAGAGASEANIARVLADGMADDAVRTLEVSRWARAVAAAAGDDPVAAVRALYAEVMEHIPGSDSPFGSRAAAVLASGRGSRAVLLKAALDELGIPAHFVAARTYEEDPAPYRFPRESRWSYLVLLVKAGGREIWLDPSVRWAPFGEIAEAAQGVPAVVLPGPGEEPRNLQTPLLPRARGRVDVVNATLTASGDLEGEGSETYDGYDAALVRQTLEKMDEDRRGQALESALARAFPGATFEGVAVDMKPGVGAPVRIAYRFRAPGFARDDGGRLALRLDFFASNLGRRFLARGTRATPLLLRDPDESRVQLTIALPPGAVVADAPRPAKEAGAFGGYERDVQRQGGKLLVSEHLRLERGRIAPDRYADFGRFVQAVDRLQQSELVLEPARSEASAAP